MGGKGERTRKGENILKTVKAVPIDTEIEKHLKELFSAFGKNLKYEKDRIATYTKYLLKHYEQFETPHFEEVCEVMILSRDFLPTLNEIVDCYDFLNWCKSSNTSKEQRIELYRKYIIKDKNNAVKGAYGAFKTLLNDTH